MEQRKKIAIIIGHSDKAQGASNQDHHVTEYQFNEPLAFLISQMLYERGYEPFTVYRNTTYTALPNEVNSTGADIALSLHCNAFNTVASGSEVLFYHTSKLGRTLAENLQRDIVDCLGLPSRGVKPCVASTVGKAGDRGGHLLKNTNMPCCILEPFFIDNNNDLMIATAKRVQLARAIVRGIDGYYAERKK